MTAGPPWRLVAALTVAGLLAVSPYGCTTPQKLSLCAGPVERIEVFNHYGDHPAADYQELDDANDIAGDCDSVWNDLALESRQFQPSELGRRSVTVLRLDLAGGSSRTIWVHRLVGFDAGSAVLYGAGESYYLRHQDIPHYYAAEAEPIPLQQVPTR